MGIAQYKLVFDAGDTPNAEAFVSPEASDANLPTLTLSLLIGDFLSDGTGRVGRGSHRHPLCQCFVPAGVLRCIVDAA